MKICQCCGCELFKVTSLFEDKKYKCENCHTLLSEDQILFKTDLTWTPSHRKPPCKVNGRECETHGECDRTRCVSYQRYVLDHTKIKALMDADKRHVSMMRECKEHAVKHNRGKVSAI